MTQRLGDFVQATPLLRGIMAGHPDATLRIAYHDLSVGEASGLFFPGAQTARLRGSDLRGGLDSQGLGKADLLVNVSMGMLNMWLVWYLGPKSIIGPRLQEGVPHVTRGQGLALAAMFLNRRLGRLNLVDIWRSYQQGSPAKLEAPRLEGIPGDLLSKLKTLDTDSAHANGPLVAVHLGAGARLRRYPAEDMAQALAIAREKIPLRVALLGTQRERALTLRFLSTYATLAPGAPAVGLAGETSVASLAALLGKADLLVSSDTGVAHLGASVGTRLLTMFFGPALCHETAPYSDRITCLQGIAPCGPCVEGRDCGRPKCLALPPSGLLGDLIVRVLGKGGNRILGDAPAKGGHPGFAVKDQGSGSVFETWESGPLAGSQNLLPVEPSPAALTDTQLTALIFRKAAIGLLFGRESGDCAFLESELLRYRETGWLRDYDAVGKDLNCIAENGLLENDREAFLDHAMALLDYFKQRKGKTWNA
jgi:hypothetical protein